MQRVICVLAVLLMLTASVTTAQFKSAGESKPNVSESIIRPNAGGLWFGLFDPGKFRMNHSYSLSYTTFGGQGLSLGMYTNSMFYQLSDPLDVQFDVSVMHSPFSSFGKEMQKGLTGIYLTKAQLNYRPSENTLFQVQFRQMPPMYWMNDPYRSNAFFGGFHLFRQEEE
ncbi:MAG: hypothetical protein FJ215_07140 [Ignavibacteria bacterium]|nr:hypothetical protein [Ignavibacteria bacterium]